MPQSIQVKTTQRWRFAANEEELQNLIIGAIRTALESKGMPEGICGSAFCVDYDISATGSYLRGITASVEVCVGEGQV